MICDAHCHFFSSGFFEAIGRDAGVMTDASTRLPERLGWDAPGDDLDLASRWSAELDRADVSRAILIASAAGDEEAVARAVGAHPERFVGAFMMNPGAPDAGPRLERAFTELGLRMACLFPAMHRVPVDDDRSDAVFAAAARHRCAVFVHCGVLSMGIRQKLGIPSRFDLRLGDPLAAAAMAVRYPDVPVIIPHFGAGMFREALMAAASAPNVYLDTSSSNSWIRLYPGLTLKAVFERALAVAGPSRLLFGSDSSFFPRGWQQLIYDTQRAILTELDVPADDQTRIFSGNFEQIWREA